MMFQAY